MIERAVFVAQKVLVVVGYWAGKLTFVGRRRPQISWVIGPREIAGVVHGIASRVPGSYSLAMAAHPFYSHDYDLSWTPTGRRRGAVRALICGPIILGWLANRAKGFVYVGGSGYLYDQLDGRSFEFAFLKRHGIKIACYWCGSDIRSTRLMHELEAEMRLPNISTYIEYIHPSFGTTRHEQLQKNRAAVADRYADIMFSFPTAQRSYLTRWTEPAYYFVDDDDFSSDDSKFDDLSRIVVVHSSSSPVIKGTQLVRSAVAALRAEGYDFEYVELIGVTNSQVLTELLRAHIALNHFYGFTTGVFALEAMAARCAVVSSTDALIEKTLPPGANDALMVTKHHEVYNHLKELLDDPARIRPLAQKGHDWAMRYTSESRAGLLVGSVLDSVLDGTYDSAIRATLPIGVLWGDER
ncbi:MAG TPA: glycosyltransferase [Galbitalea sp.]|jgi:glycosyltransferase involved in cell wall biosynthesis|nr:glycosyltransferase [Galbitalea sp.]